MRLWLNNKRRRNPGGGKLSKLASTRSAVQTGLGTNAALDHERVDGYRLVELARLGSCVSAGVSADLHGFGDLGLGSAAQSVCKVLPYIIVARA